MNGNRTLSGYSTGTGNRLTSDGTYNYTYDDNGNMLTKTRISDSQKYEFTWDYRNRLSQVLLKNSGGTILQQSDFTYDAFDRRIIKSFDDDGPGPHAATVMKTLYDGASFAANPYADFNSSNNLSTRYGYGPTVDMILIRQDASGNASWYLAGQLGTVRDIANTIGAILDHVRYSAFGEVTAETSSSSGDRFKFAARDYDGETGQYHCRARPYAPSVGRFMNIDPISFGGGDLNLYRYAWNQPGRFNDPLGLQQQPPPAAVTQRVEGRNSAIQALAGADGAVNRSENNDPSAQRLDAGRSVISGTGTGIQLAVPILMEYGIAHVAGAAIPWTEAAEVGLRLPGWLARLFGRTRVTVEILDDAGKVIRTMTASSGDEAAVMVKYVKSRLDFLRRIEEKFRGMSNGDIAELVPKEQKDVLRRAFGSGPTRRGADAEAVKELTKDTIEKYAEIARRMVADQNDNVGSQVVRLGELLQIVE